MDLATIIGLGASLVVVIVVMILDGGTPMELLAHPSAILLTLVGSMVCTISTMPFEGVVKIPIYISKAFISKKVNLPEIINTLASMADKARREGLLALEEESKKIPDPFLRQGIMLVVDGTDPSQVRAILELEIKNMEERHEIGINFFNTAGGFSPTFGIIGTVMGLISVLKQLDDPGKLAKSIAAAFLATLWGLLSANLIWLPIGGKLALRSKEEVNYRHMLLEGILSLQAGENPRIIKEKLSTFLPPAERKHAEGGAGAQAGAKA
ncbi:MAG: motility protein A [Chloroflexi bacterium]|nr:motility protein A [Chloroflexota bacterium]BCY17907.1 motility protein A [Leptolinea sp. HRD-7]